MTLLNQQHYNHVIVSSAITWLQRSKRQHAHSISHLSAKLFEYPRHMQRVIDLHIH